MYKELKEAWVSNQTGSAGLQNVCLLMLTCPLATLFQRAISGALNIRQRDHGGTGLLAFLTDFMAVVMPMLTSFLLWNSVLYIYAFLVVCSLLAIWGAPSRCIATTKTKIEILEGAQKPFLTNFRTTMMLCTCIAILAVDFRIFPREFAKTENYGVSLMDIGVGGFVFSLGLVSIKARSAVTSRSYTWRGNIMLNLKAMVPTLVLGFGRFMLIKATDYQQHVSEYGVHWNFFFTLAFVSLFGVILDIPVRYTGGLGLLLLTVYQIVLSVFEYDQWIQTAPRIDLISQNKEGIFSLSGYTSLYLMSSQVGHYILQRGRTIHDWTRLCVNLMSLSVVFWALGYIVFERGLGILPSRKMANFTYVCYVMCVVLQALAFLLGLDLFILPQNHWLIDTVSQRRHSQLMVFLLANLFTGLVNVTVPTLFVSDVMSFLIVTMYMFAVCGVPYVFWILFYQKQKLKK